ncbi:P2Y purinoceptor 4-like [Dendropsophus ebraccatus]|uniref:P2Y purinoceptor 4-like n=1 Tax=Dendropsophus ebraccatus TaxID=150705 RepID=UPI0038321411
MNISANFTRCQPQTINPIIPIFLSFLYSIGFVLNCISLWIFWFRVKQWNSTVILQFNLAIADAIITPAAPLIIISSFTDHWTFGTFFCQFKLFLLCTHVYGSIYFLTLISVHRYFSVVYSNRKAFTKKPFITKLCIVVWCCLFLQGFPIFFLLKTSEMNGVTKCLSLYQKNVAIPSFVWNWVVLFSGVLIPFTITLVCYSLLSRYILKVNPMNTITNVMVNKSVQTIFVSLIIFIICFIPIHIAKNMAVTIILYFPSRCTLLKNVEVAFYFVSILFGTNCCIDPILYCYATEKFRQTLTNWCSCPILINRNRECPS